MAGNNGNGRKKGVPNKRTQGVIDQLEALDCDPIEGDPIDSNPIASNNV